MAKVYKWCAIDAEGDVGDKGLLGVSFYYDYKGEYLTDHDKIADAIGAFARAGYTFCAHNAEYDLSVIFWQLEIPMKAVYFGGRFNRGEWRYDKRKTMCQLWDTLALSGGISLKDLGQAIGYQKLDTPQRLLGIDPNKYNWICPTHNTGECVECYAIRDAEIVYRYMVSLTSTLSGWGIEPKRRLSGLASHVWRRLDNPQSIGLSDKRIKRLARQSYHGGRTETFKLGTVNPCYTADVTSMYPSVMASTPYPDPKTLVSIDRPLTHDFMVGSEGIADVLITVPPMYVPPLPYRYHDKLHYPVGRMRGVWTLHELRYAMTLGCEIHKVYKAVYTHSLLYPFANFIGVLWAMREEYQRTSDPRAIFAKLLMNNLYGYLGMRDDMVRKDIGPSERGVLIRDQPKTAWFTMDGELYLIHERPQPSRNIWTNVMWASQTTAAARVVLHRHLIAQGSSLLYCDTDSVFSMSPIVNTSEGIGGLRQDGDYQSILIAAPKLYALQGFDGSWSAKAKGVNRASALGFLRDGTATFSQPIRPPSQARRNLKAGTWVTVTKDQHYAPARRIPLDVQAVLSESGYSDTSPTVVLPDE